MLSGYYGDQARAFAGLKKTPEAVDAAAAAVVAWGNNINNRSNALEALRAVLCSAPDLEAYVVRLDKQAAEIHEENPILRKAIGQVYREKGTVGQGDRATAHRRRSAAQRRGNLSGPAGML